MRFENGNGVKAWSDVNHNDHKKTSGRMPYITVTENAVKWWITVHYVIDWGLGVGVGSNI